LVGTSYLPSFEGAILFLEDTGVRPYQIDRMLTQLRLAGCLEGVRGLVFGEMPDCDQHPDQGYSTEELISDLTAEFAVPVMFGFPSGHTTAPAWTLPLGIRARLDAGGLSLLEGAVT
jgi:muramoyltetrapeptide carboxypeptidase